jgi:signal transduction histidine kinase
MRPSNLLLLVRPITAIRRLRYLIHHRLRWKLIVAHLIVVILSTFVYATGGFFLLVLLLIISNKTWASIIQALPAFLGLTLFTLTQIALIAICGVFVSFLASRRLARRITRPLEAMEDASEAMANGHLDRRVDVQSDDEIGRLARRFNYLAERLEALDRQRRDFVANISHDLRTPLAIIQGHLETQLDNPDAPTLPLGTVAAFRAIEHESQTLAKLIDDLFTLTRLEEAALPMASETVDIVHLVELAVSGIRPYALQQSRVSVHSAIPSDLPAVRADPTRVTQIINNLLHNAVRHTPHGGLVMVNGAVLEEGRQLEISVADTGVGIAPEDLPRIFDRFYRGESTRNAGSTGLGLSIVKQLVEVQGGQVSAASVLGEGTTIRFTLPVALEANEAKGAQSTSVMEPAKIGVSSRIDASSSNV